MKTVVADIKPFTGTDILALPMYGNDADAKTVREYLVGLARQVWSEGECFSGKRPFGNSGWQSDFDAPLVVAGFARGVFEETVEDGQTFFEVDDVNDRDVSDAILLALDALGALPIGGQIDAAWAKAATLGSELRAVADQLDRASKAQA